MVRSYTRHSSETVLAAIIEYKTAHDGASPTLREIADYCDIASNSTVHRLLRELADGGRIRLPAGTNRGIEVAGGRWMLADPAARFPRPEAPGTCDICGQKAAWRDGRFGYCRLHAPAEAP